MLENRMVMFDDREDPTPVTVSDALAYGDEHPQMVEINGALAAAFYSSDIERILIKHLTELDKTKILAFCEDSDYADWYRRAYGI